MHTRTPRPRLGLWLALAALTALDTLPAPAVADQGEVSTAPAAPQGDGPPYGEPSPEHALGSCESPQHAIYQLLYWLQPERWEPARASRCFDFGALDAVDGEGPRRAEHLKRVLDARALYVRWSDIPDDPDYVDPRTRKHSFKLFPNALPNVEVVKQRDRWVFSGATVDAVPALYAESFPFELDRLVEALPDWLLTRVVGLTLWQLAALVFLVFLGLLLQRIVVLLVAVWIRRAADRVDSEWVGRIVDAASKPLGGIAMAGIFAVGVPLLQFPIGVGKVAMLSVRVLAAFSLVWLGYRLIDVVALVFERRAEKTETKLDNALVPLVRKAIKVVLVAVGSIFMLQNLDVDVGSLLAGLGLGGLAFALAAKDTVANLFGSVMIFMDKPFQVGDWIKIGGDVEGTVEEVGFRSTRVRTFYNSLITVPNARVADAAIDNLGARQYRRYRTTLSVTYDTPPEKITAFCDGIKGLIAALPGMRKDFDMVEFTEFGASSLNIMLYAFMHTPDWATEMRTRHNLNLAILQLAKELGVEFAYPTQTLYVERFPETTAARATHREGYSADQLEAIAASYGPGGQGFRTMSQRRLKAPDGAVPRRGEVDG